VSSYYGVQYSIKTRRAFKQIPNLKDFYWAKEALRILYSAKDKNEAAELLELIIMNLKDELKGL